MLEKFKRLGEAAKSVIIFIITPVVFVAGIIYYLVKQKNTLQSELQREKSGRELDQVKNKATEAEKESEDAVKNYNDIRDAYKREHPDDQSS